MVFFCSGALFSISPHFLICLFSIFIIFFSVFSFLIYFASSRFFLFSLFIILLFLFYSLISFFLLSFSSFLLSSPILLLLILLSDPPSSSYSFRFPSLPLPSYSSPLPSYSSSFCYRPFILLSRQNLMFCLQHLFAASLPRILGPDLIKYTPLLEPRLNTPLHHPHRRIPPEPVQKVPAVPSV